MAARSADSCAVRPSVPADSDDEGWVGASLVEGAVVVSDGDDEVDETTEEIIVDPADDVRSSAVTPVELVQPDRNALTASNAPTAMARSRILLPRRRGQHSESRWPSQPSTIHESAAESQQDRIVALEIQAREQGTTPRPPRCETGRKRSTSAELSTFSALRALVTGDTAT